MGHTQLPLQFTKRIKRPADLSHPSGVEIENVLRYVSCPYPCVYDNYRGADMSLARPTSLCILFDGENISFDDSLVIYIYIYIYI
jgi:hypothetical protein